MSKKHHSSTDSSTTTFKINVGTLKNVDLILAEDTRHTLKLLNSFDIKTRMEAYHKFNEKKKSNEIKDAEAVIVDEAQFLNEMQVDELMDIVIDLNIPVMCFGLRTDFQGVAFPGARRLLEIAHELTEMKTICACGKKAMFNVRLMDGRVTTTGDSVAIDGEGKITYTVACARCYRLKTRQNFRDISKRLNSKNETKIEENNKKKNK